MLQTQRKFCIFLLAKFSTFKNPKCTTTKTSPSAPFIKPITVHVGTGDNLYPRLQARHPNILFPLKLPTTKGCQMTVKVADSASDNLAENSHKTIVALHGTPGSLEHFDVLFHGYVHQLQCRSVRIIAPNLPDFSHTRASGGLFWHTTEEKVAFLQDLLKRLQVSTIDCLVAHSMGAQLALALAENPGTQLRIRSMALLAPQPLFDPVTPSVRASAQRLFRLAHKGAISAEVWYRLLEAVQLQKRVQSVYKFATTNELFWALTTLLDLQTPLDVPRRVYKLARQSSMPIAIQYGTKEPIISHRTQRLLLTEHFGVPEELFIYLDLSGADKGDLAKIKPGGDRIKVYYIKDGTHFAHARYAQATVQMIDSLLQTIQE